MAMSTFNIARSRFYLRYGMKYCENIGEQLSVMTMYLK